jgi:hypothetical protein
MDWTNQAVWARGVEVDGSEESEGKGSRKPEARGSVKRS